MTRVVGGWLVAVALLAAGCGGAVRRATSPTTTGTAVTTGAPPTSIMGAASGTTSTLRAAVPSSSPRGRSSGTALPPPPPGPNALSSDWPMYNRTTDRAGLASGIRPNHLSVRWKAHLDGAVYGQPLVVGGAVIVATEGDTVAALDPATGHVRWSTHLGTPETSSDLPCGNVSPLGITGTPVYDQATGSVLAVTETGGGAHDLVALDARSGSVRWRRNLDVTNRDKIAEQQRAALAVGNGRVYVALGGLYGDCGNYVGYVAAVATTGQGPVTHWEVPTSREGGIWASPGPSIGADGSVFVSVGNGAAESGSYDGSDSVDRLTPDLARRADYFAPATWAVDNSQDADLGSTGPLLLPGHLAIVAGKSGTVYLLDTNHLGEVGGSIASLSGCTGYGGSAADGSAAFLPCAEGVTRVETAGRTLRNVWTASGTSGPPVVGGGVVWSIDVHGGVLHALDEGSGRDLVSVGVGSVTHFAAPTVVGPSVYIPTTSGVTAVAAA